MRTYEITFRRGSDRFTLWFKLEPSEALLDLHREFGGKWELSVVTHYEYDTIEGLRDAARKRIRQIERTDALFEGK